MKLPSINIAFSSAAASAVQRSQKGTVAIILKDSAANGAHALTKATDIPGTLSAANQGYISRAFLGYVYPPKKVLVYVLAAAAANLSAALDHFETLVSELDYLVGPPETDADDALEIATWIAAMRADGFTPKAVLPDYVADSEGVINFTTDGIVVGSTTFTTPQYCSRIAGLLAGTPMTISSTYAPLPEVSNVTRLSKDDMDTAVEAGKFIIFHDGIKVKVGRGVNSLTTLTADKGEAFQKIKIVEAIDMIRKDIRATAEDSYIGKYANSYDNKCLLISAIKSYLSGLETAGILQSGASVVEIDLAAQESYLQDQGIDTAAMTDQEIKEANTGDQVFFRTTIKILDAIEDIDLDITI
jgi:hypothetical protein